MLDPGRGARMNSTTTSMAQTGRRRSGIALRLGWGAFSLLWFATLAVAVAMCGAGLYFTKSYYDAIDGPLAEFGLRDAVTVGFGGVRLKAPLSRAGGLATLRRADVVVSVNGAPVLTGANVEADFVRQVQASGPIGTVRTRSMDGTVRDHRIERTPAHAAAMRAQTGFDMWSLTLLTTGLGTLAALVLLAAGVLLYTRRTRDPVAGLIAFGFCALAGAIGPAWAVNSHFPGFSQLSGLLNALGGTAMLFAIVLFPNGRLETPLAKIVAGLLGFYGLYLSLEVFGLTDGSSTALIGIALVMSSGLILVLRYRRLPVGLQRQQIRWATFGFALAGLIVQPLAMVLGTWGVWSENLTVSVWSSGARAALNLLLAITLAGGLLISLMRYRLYDADMVISRSAGYAILTLALAGVWAGAEKTLEVLFEGQFGHEAGAASAGVAAALAALLVTPAHHRVMHWTEHVFQKALSRLRLHLPQTVGDLRETASLSELLQTVLAEASAGVRATRSAVVLRSEDGLAPVTVRDVSEDVVTDWLGRVGTILAGRDRDDPIFPLRLSLTDAGETFGWLILGPRPDGSFYGRDELEALGEITGPVSRAMRIVLAREAKDRLWQRRFDEFTEELATLRKVVAPVGTRRRTATT